MSSKGIGWLLYIMLSLIWGSAYLLMKRGLLGLDPLQLASLRIGTGSLLLMPFALYHLRKVPAKNWPILTFTGFLGSVFPAVMFAMAQQVVSSGVSGVGNTLTPVWVVIVGYLFFKKKATTRQLIGLSIGLIGSLLLVFINVKGDLDFSQWQGVLILLATMSYGLNLNILKYRLVNISTVQLASLTLFFWSPICWIYVFKSGIVTQYYANPDVLGPSIGYTMLLGASSTAFAAFLFNVLVKAAPAVFVSSITYVVSIVAVLWGIYDGEVFTTAHIISMLLTVSGIILMGRSK